MGSVTNSRDTEAGQTVTPEDVREGLERLYDNLALARAPLARQLPQVASLAGVQERAQVLRRLLLSSIELLQPARPEPFGSRAGRSHEVLALRYIEGMSITQVADELSLVERQVYRDLRRAYQELAQLLNTLAPPDVAVPGSAEAAANQAGMDRAGAAGAASPLQEELSRLAASPKRLDARHALESASEAVLPLATRLGVSLQADLAADLPAVVADEGVLRQMLIQVLSLAAQSAASGRVWLTARQESGDVVLGFGFRRAEGQPLGREDRLASLARLAETQGMLWQARAMPDGTTTLSISLKAAQPRTVLVIEDNEGAIELYRRYLARSDEWQVVGAADPRVGLELAARLRPAVILLDIMMPRQDGWSVLQLLRSQAETAGIAVIICSVFSDPELASALGANAYLKKPVSQLELLAALHRATP
jgi:CheY-like chemotaxis protein